MSEFNKDAAAFVPRAKATAAAAEPVSPAKKIENAVDDITASVASVKIRHNLDGDRTNYRNTVNHLKSGITFADFEKIPQACLQALTHDLRYNEPTQIQAEAIPPTLMGRNILAQAQAGSGKSIAFAIGILHQVDTTAKGVQAICIAPTRHLASQLVADAVAPLSKHMDPPCIIELGVRSEDKNDRGPARGASCMAHVVVGTAGTISKWIKDRYINANGVKIFVVDEADEMVRESNGSASTQVKQIKNKLPKDVQTLFYSATYPPDIMTLAKSLVGENAITIKVEKVSDLIVDKIFQVKIECRGRSKVDILEDIYTHFSIQQSMIFCETKAQCDEVAGKLHADGFTCSVIHRNILNADEEFELFRRNVTKVLICTDILARGIDVPAVAIVINYNAPRLFDERAMRFSDKANCDTYAHRIARSCRMGNPGTAITLMSTPCDAKVVGEIERYFDTALHNWSEDDVDTLAEKHKLLQSGASIASVLGDEKKAATVEEVDDGSDWAA